MKKRKPALTPQARQDIANTFRSLAGAAIEHPSGAGSSHQALRYDLIPREFLALLAKRFTLGAETYAPYAYRKGLRDKSFIVDRIGHIHEHLDKLLQPLPGEQDDFEGNLGAIGWGLAFLSEVWADAEGRKIIEGIMRK